MYRVLIADDEPWIAYGLSRLIDWEGQGFIIVGEAADGLSALTMIREQQPDVVLSDIRMPGLDGLELLEHIAREGIHTEVVFISGYSEFEYAQQALRLGAFDYLLKQVEKPKLLEVIQRLKDKLDKKKQDLNAIDGLLKDLFELFETHSKIKISHFLQNKGLAFKHPHYRFITGTFEQGSDILPIEQLYTDAGVNVLSFRTGRNKLAFLINYDEYFAPLGFLDFISYKLMGFAALGISSIGVYSTPIGKLYQESDIALYSQFSQPDTRIIEYRTAEPSPVLAKLILTVELAIKERKHEQIFEGVEHLFTICVSNRLLIDQMAQAYNQIVSLIYKHFAGSQLLSNIEYLSYDQLARHFKSPNELCEALKAFFELQRGSGSGAQRIISNDQVAKILSHIDSSFTEDILLSQLAVQYNISLGYLSQLIKKETGKTYSEYVLDKRLDLAKQLLLDASLSVYEVVERVGYKDYFHFNKLFKKYFGVTPSKYRKL